MFDVTETLGIALRQNVEGGAPHDVSRAIKDLSRYFQRAQREGNFLDGSVSVLAHVVEEGGLSSAEASRLRWLLDDVEIYRAKQFANIRSFRRMFLDQQMQDKLVGEIDSTNWPFSWIYNPLGNQETQAPSEKGFAYWRMIRDALTAWFALRLDQLSAALGVSYATFANLGKHRPQARTVRPILGLYSLAKACIDIGGNDARSWLASEGRELLLQHGLPALEQAANERLFKGATVPRTAIVIEETEEAPIASWVKPVETSKRRSERF